MFEPGHDTRFGLQLPGEPFLKIVGEDLQGDLPAETVYGDGWTSFQIIAARTRRLRYSLAPMLVSEMMSRNLVTASPGETVAIARDRLRVNQIHHLLVMSGEDVVGVLAFRDLAGKPDDVRVEELMAKEIATIDAAATLRRAASLMIRSTTGCLPVLENGKIAGIITTTDLMKVLNTDMTLS